MDRLRGLSGRTPPSRCRPDVNSTPPAAARQRIGRDLSWSPDGAFGRPFSHSAPPEAAYGLPSLLYAQEGKKVEGHTPGRPTTCLCPWQPGPLPSSSLRRRGPAAPGGSRGWLSRPYHRQALWACTGHPGPGDEEHHAGETSTIRWWTLALWSL